jgi:acetyl esterase/lipase
MKHHLLFITVALIVLSSCGNGNSLLSSSPSASASSPASMLSSSTSSALSSTESSANHNPEVTFIQVPYGLDPRQTLEIAYRPNDVNPSPVVLFIHGGSWISGDRSMMRRYQDQVVNAGYIYVSMNYRFVLSGATYLDMLDDIRLTIQFLKDFAIELNVDTTRMAMVGESAGAHLAMLYAYRNVSPIPISFVMALVPPVDFTDPGYLSFNDPNVQLFLANGLMGTTLTGPEDITNDGYPPSWIDASPISHLANAIPTLIGYAGLDELIPFSNMERFLIMSTSTNSPIQAILFPNSGHGLNGDPDKLTELLTTFFIYLNNFLPITTPSSSVIIDN